MKFEFQISSVSTLSMGNFAICRILGFPEYFVCCILYFVFSVLYFVPRSQGVQFRDFFSPASIQGFQGFSVSSAPSVPSVPSVPRESNLFAQPAQSPLLILATVSRRIARRARVGTRAATRVSGVSCSRFFAAHRRNMWGPGKMRVAANFEFSLGTS